LYVEQAYILLEKKQADRAKEILIRKTKSENIQKCIVLAIKFEFIDEYIGRLINKANRNTSDVNILLEYIDYFSNPEQIIA